jgi:alkanesulfonate monooxygenase SsuD/methylene tetrahydromethanopterin reductase-like flavin-dependent oxidoreductase (luciferase family)
MLGDAENWNDIDEMGSIFVGSPDTVYERLWEFVEQANVGNLLIQFHIGNLSYELTQKSQKIFAEKVLPRLRKDSEALFKRKFAGAQAAGQTTN